MTDRADAVLALVDPLIEQAQHAGAMIWGTGDSRTKEAATTQREAARTAVVTAIHQLAADLATAEAERDRIRDAATALVTATPTANPGPRGQEWFWAPVRLDLLQWLESALAPLPATTPTEPD